MTPVDFQSLITKSSPSDRLALLLQLLQLQSVPITAWDSGAVGTGFLNVDALAIDDVAGMVAQLAKFCSVDLADDPDWLDFATASQYSETSNPAVFTQGSIALEDPNNAGPFTIEAGQLYATDASGTLIFINQTGGTLAQGAALLRSGTTVTGAGSAFVCTWQAESPGAAYNLAPGDIVALASALPGVIVSNPVIAPATTWITQAGSDRESMAALVTRCKAKWGTLGPGIAAPGYDAIAKAAAPGIITRTAIVQGTPLNGLTVYIGTDAGAPDAGTVAAVSAYVLKRSPQCVPVVVSGAINEILDFNASITVLASNAAATIAAVKAAVGAYLKTLNIGGTVLVSELYRITKSVSGVQDCTFNFGNQVLPPFGIDGSATISYSNLVVTQV